MPYHLAQLNIARMLYPLDDPRMAGFVNQLDEINTLAEASDGFVWRFQSDAGNATEYRPFDDDFIIVNMSVWESVEALHNYTYKSGHAKVFKQRKQWFERTEGYMVLWWLPAGDTPTVEQAKQRLNHLTQHGPTHHAFIFRQHFPAP